MDIELAADTLDDLRRARTELEAVAGRLDQEYRRHEAAAESARYDRDVVDGRIDRLSALLGDRDGPNWQLRRRQQAADETDTAALAGQSVFARA